MNCRFIAFSFIFLFSATVAASNCDEVSEDCAKVGQWQVSLGLGYGQRSNPIANGGDTSLVLLPQWNYYGERFFLENLTAGFTLSESERQQFNLVLLPSFDQVGFESAGIGNLFIEEGAGNFVASSPEDSTDVVPSTADGLNYVENDAPEQIRENSDNSTSGEGTFTTFRIDRRDLASRSTALLGGVEYTQFWGAFGLSAMALTDTIDAHGGQELRLAASWQNAWQRQALKIAAGINWQSDKVVDHYYGVREDDTNIAALHYQAEAELSQFMRVDWRYRLNRKWHLQATVHQKWLGDEISASPIVTSDTVTTWFFGGVYHF